MRNPHSFSVNGKWPESVLEQGFTAVPNSLIRYRSKLDITIPEFFVIVAIDSFRWDNWNQPFPSLKTLALVTGLSERQVSRITGALEGKGYIVKTRRYNKTNLYDLTPLGEELEYYIGSSVST